MIGYMVLGGLMAVVFSKMLRMRHGGCWRGWHHHRGWRHRGWGHHQPYGPGGWDEMRGDDGYGPDFGGGRRRGVGFAVRFLSDRLEATPAQERQIAQALEDLRAEVEPLRDEGKKTRSDLAAALRRPSLDEVLFGELFARHDEAMDKARKAFMGAVGKLHEALDERQRERLATLVERGPRFFGYGRPW
jgi:hypothetical protein